MKYDFDKLTDRKNTNSLKWNVAENELPMWVADMDFETAPEIKAAICERAEHGIFGYTVVPKEWYDAYIHWWQSRHNFKIQSEQLIFLYRCCSCCFEHSEKADNTCGKGAYTNPCI